MISKSTMMALPLDQTRRCCTLARSPMWVEVSQQEEVRCYAFALRPSRCRSLQKLNSESAPKVSQKTRLFLNLNSIF